jgi:hypothetical protein
VAVREVWRGRVWLARAWRLVDDAPPGTVVLANRPGSETRIPVDETGARLRVPGAEWRLRRSQWQNWTLRVAHAGDPFSTLLFFDDRRELSCWYVNFERPLERTAIGWDTLDWKLDLVVLPDGTTRLKDEAELAEAAARNVVDEREVRAALGRVLADPPWPTGWEDRPPPHNLEPATLPRGWDET